MTMLKRPTGPTSLVLLSASLPLVAGCASPVQPERVEVLQAAVRHAAAAELEAASRRPEEVAMPEPNREVRDTFSPERLEELQELSGPESYAHVVLDLGPDLLGEESQEVGLTLHQAIISAIEHNPDLQAARLSPAISEADVVAAEALFDVTLFAEYSMSWLDQPAVITSGFGTGQSVVETRSLETGIRKVLTTGGQLTVSTQLERSDVRTPGVTSVPDPAYNSNVLLGISQPLLRNFGSNIALAEVRAARDQHRQQIESLRSSMISLVNQTEQAYWQLLQARWNLLVRERLLERGLETRDQVKARLGFDTTPAEYSDAVARVESRRADLIEAKALVRQASDTLKLVINHPDLAVGAETLIVPTDDFLGEPVALSLLDAMSTGVNRRPEVLQALLNMDIAAIQVMLADNARLPILDLAASMQFNGLDDEWEESYSEVSETSYVDYLLRLQFEYPLGNRAAEAQYRRARLQQNQTVISYRNVLRQVVLDVKTAVRNARTDFQLVSQRDEARLAAAENLRTLTVQEDVTALTPDFLDLKFGRQEALAAAELQHIQALVDYNVSLANLYAAMGTALERNQIDFVVPEGDDF
ncbi:MAG: TolC family protein [Phycisphaerales bacterium JB038]